MTQYLSMSPVFSFVFVLGIMALVYIILKGLIALLPKKKQYPVYSHLFSKAYDIDSSFELIQAQRIQYKQDREAQLMKIKKSLHKKLKRK